MFLSRRLVDLFYEDELPDSDIEQLSAWLAESPEHLRYFVSESLLRQDIEIGLIQHAADESLKHFDDFFPEARYL